MKIWIRFDRLERGFVHHQNVRIPKKGFRSILSRNGSGSNHSMLIWIRLDRLGDELSTTKTSLFSDIISSILNPGFWFHIIKQKIRIQPLMQIWIRMDGPGGGFISHQNVLILQLPKKRVLDLYNQGKDPDPTFNANLDPDGRARRRVYSQPKRPWIRIHLSL